MWKQIVITPNLKRAKMLRLRENFRQKAAAPVEMDGRMTSVPVCGMIMMGEVGEVVEWDHAATDRVVTDQVESDQATTDLVATDRVATDQVESDQEAEDPVE